MKCRHCQADLSLELVNLGEMPVSNAFRTNRFEREQTYPLRVLVCTDCWLAQTDMTHFELGYDEVFRADYPYFSSTSASFVEHARQYAETVTKRFELGPESLTVEIGSNDGYLLQWFKTPCYGVEPTETGEEAKKKRVTSCSNFFTSKFAKNARGWRGPADLMIANNVLAHVPDINDFVKGFQILLKDDGVATFEFPHLLNLVRFNQFDTIYNEHYSYLSLIAVHSIMHRAGLKIFDVEKLTTHGGSLRVYACKDARTVSAAVFNVLAEERAAGMEGHQFYSGFQTAVNRVKDEFLRFMVDAKAMKRTVVGFGAAAKGNTFLNYAGIKADLLPYVVDDTPAKQGKYLPGSRIPVLGGFTTAPDYVLILPWNFREEIIEKLSYLRSRVSYVRFVCAIPRLEIL